MTLLRRLVSVVRWMTGRGKAEDQLDAELRAYIEMSATEKMRDGVSREEAQRLARLEFGGLEQVKEQVRTRRHGALLDEMGRNMRQAVRMFAKQPGFTLVIVLTLALGIGANATIFSLIDALMLRWLPVHEPQELLLVKMQMPDESRVPKDTEGFNAFSYPIARGLADHTEIFAGLAGFSGFSFEVGTPGEVNRVAGAVVTGQFYSTLGLTPVLGRLLTTDDDEPGKSLVAVISDGYWQREFGRDPAVIGRTLLIGGVPVTVVGATPPGFNGVNVGSVAEITIPAAALPQINPPMAALLQPGNFWLRILARRRPNVSSDEARARLRIVWPQMAERVIAPHWPAARRKAMADGVFDFDNGSTGWTYLREIYRKPLFILMAMVGVVLLIACANIAGLLLARASARQREMAVRLAIGAGRMRVIGQLLTESTMLSLTGAAAGIGLAGLSSRFLVRIMSTGPGLIAFDLTPNWHVLAFTTVVAVATGILFGVAPAFQITAAGPSSVLAAGTRITAARSRLLPVLVSVQVALSLALLIGASLFVRTLNNLQKLDPGFNREGVLLVNLEGARTAAPPQLVDEVRAVPGVISASVSTHTPLSGATWTEPAVPSGQPLPERDTAIFVGAGPLFFETMQIPVLGGRTFTTQDAAGSQAVAIIDEAYVERYFRGRIPIGEFLSARVRGKSEELEIVGIVKNTKSMALRRPPYPHVFVPYAQLTGDFPTTLEIKAAGLLGKVAAAVRSVVQAKVPGIPVQVVPLSAQVDASIVRERMMATLAAAFGLLALMLACIGLYGVLAYRVARRTKEIAICMALGAQRRQVITPVLISAGRLVAVGIAMGVPIAWAASRWIESMLFRLKPTDPMTLAAAILLLAAVALVAAFIPAWRASRIDPISALHYD